MTILTPDDAAEWFPDIPGTPAQINRLLIMVDAIATGAAGSNRPLEQALVTQQGIFDPIGACIFFDRPPADPALALTLAFHLELEGSGLQDGYRDFRPGYRGWPSIIARTDVEIADPSEFTVYPDRIEFNQGFAQRMGGYTVTYVGGYDFTNSVSEEVLEIKAAAASLAEYMAFSMSSGAPIKQDIASGFEWDTHTLIGAPGSPGSGLPPYLLGVFAKYRLAISSF